MSIVQIKLSLPFTNENTEAQEEVSHGSKITHLEMSDNFRKTDWSPQSPPSMCHTIYDETYSFYVHLIHNTQQT